MDSDRGMDRRVVIVGAGAVGSTFAYALAQSGLAEEIVLLDSNRDLLSGQVLDLAHGEPFFPTVRVRGGTEADYADAQLVVITAGAKQAPGEDRRSLLRKNRAVIEGIMDGIVRVGTRAVVLVVSNPVDVLTHVALERSGWPRGRVIGSGTVLDSARFRHLLSRHCAVDVHDIQAFILGEHGDSEFAAWSLTHVAGMPMDGYCAGCGRCAEAPLERRRIEEEVRRSAYHIIDYKGATWFAVGMALVEIAGAILRNRRSLLTVSVRLEGEYGLRGACMGVPAIVSREGVERIVEGPLVPEEQQLLERSAEVVGGVIRDLKEGAGAVGPPTPPSGDG